MPSNPRRLSLAKKLTLGFALFAAAGICGEIGVRVDDYIRSGIPFRAAPSYGDLVYQDSLTYRGMPNGRFRDFRLDSAGFRSSDAAIAARPGCTRVMTLGASETFGSMNAPGNEYPAQLEDSLARYGCFRVLNAGIVGMGLRPMTQFWEHWAAEFHPDVVVVLSLPTLYLGDSPPTFRKPRPVSHEPARFTFASRLSERLHDFIEYPDFIQRVRVQNHLADLTAGRNSDWFYSSLPVDRIELYARDLDSLLTAIRAAGSEPILAAYPTVFGDTIAPEDSALMAAWREYSPRARPNVMLAFMSAAREAVRQLGRSRAVTVVDLPARLNGHTDLFADVNHYSDKGASVVAGMVAAAVVGGQTRGTGGPSLSGDNTSTSNQFRR